MKYRFGGGRTGEYLNGIPAKSLSEEEYDALPAEQRKQVRESSLYTEVADAPAHPPAKAEDKAPAAEDKAPTKAEDKPAAAKAGEGKR